MTLSPQAEARAFDCRGFWRPTEHLLRRIRCGGGRKRRVKKATRGSPFCPEIPETYLFLFAIMSWISGVRISSMAKPILAPGTTMVLRRDMKEFGIMFSR